MGSRIGSDYDANLSAEDNEGVLWMKQSNSYVKTWCTLKDEIFSVYEMKDGNKIKEINIEVCKITLVMKDGSNNSYFRINNDLCEFTFGTKHKNEFKVWMKKFESINLNTNNKNNVDQNEYDECTPLSDKTDSINNFDLESPDQKNEFDSSDLFTCEKNKHITNLEEKRFPSDEINKFKLIRDLERQIRDKSLWLSKIDEVLKMSHIPNEIDLFFEEYQMNFLE